MDWRSPIIATSISFVFLILVFVPMEKVFPAKRGQKFFRKHWVLDLSFFLGQYLLWGGIVIWALNYFGEWLDNIVPASFRKTVAGQPWWLRAIEVVVLSDFLIYWGHRLQHNVGFLWRFHKVHHCAEHLDWLAAHREHPLDSIYTIGIINLKFLRLLIGAPELHHWHHDRDRHAGNYANISPLMDVVFGTYTCPDHEPERYGINEPVPKNYIGQLLEPILPNFFARKLGLIKKQEPVTTTNNEVCTKTSSGHTMREV